jgi:hypothetical protein
MRRRIDRRPHLGRSHPDSPYHRTCCCRCHLRLALIDERFVGSHRLNDLGIAGRRRGSASPAIGTARAGERCLKQGEGVAELDDSIRPSVAEGAERDFRTKPRG